MHDSLPSLRRSILLPNGYSRHARYPIVIWLCEDSRDRLEFTRTFPLISQEYLAVGLEYPHWSDVCSHPGKWDGLLLDLLYELPANRQKLFVCGSRHLGPIAWELSMISSFHVTAALALESYLPLPVMTQLLRAGTEQPHRPEQTLCPLFWLPDSPLLALDSVREHVLSQQIPIEISRASSLSHDETIWDEVRTFLARCCLAL